MSQFQELANERKKKYKELKKRIEREKELHIIAQKMERKKQLTVSWNILDWPQSLKQFFTNVSYHILVASLTLMALF